MQLLACRRMDTFRTGAIVTEPDRVERYGGLMGAIEGRTFVGLEGDGSRAILGDLNRGQIVALCLGGGCKASGGGGMKGPCSLERESLGGCGLKDRGDSAVCVSYGA